MNCEPRPVTAGQICSPARLRGPRPVAREGAQAAGVPGAMTGSPVVLDGVIAVGQRSLAAATRYGTTRRDRSSSTEVMTSACSPDVSPNMSPTRQF